MTFDTHSTADPADDRVVISAVLAGDHNAFDSLMSRYERLVFKVAYGITREHDDALDVAQVAFLKAFRSLDSFRGGASCKSWIARIAYNEGLNWLRRHRRHRSGRQDVEVVDELGLAEQPPRANKEGEPEAALLEQERDALLRRGIDQLKPRYRMAMILRYQEELSVREVAEALSCTEGNAKSLLFRGVRMLRDLLELEELGMPHPSRGASSVRGGSGPRGLVGREVARGENE